MTRHGRNATNSAVYTYHERKKDANAAEPRQSPARDSSGDTCHTGEDSPPRCCCCCLTAVGVVDVVAVTALVLSCRQLPDEW